MKQSLAYSWIETVIGLMAVGTGAACLLLIFVVGAALYYPLAVMSTMIRKIGGIGE